MGFDDRQAAGGDVEARVAELLMRLEQGDAGALSRACLRYPGLRRELRQAHVDWSRLRAAIDRSLSELELRERDAP